MEKQNKGVTLIALIITIIILLMLAGITIVTLTGENGLLNKAKLAKEETNKQTAIEIVKLKITSAQTKSYSEFSQLPTLQYLADYLCEDDEVEYVELESKIASLDKISVEDNNSIYSKLKDYPFEFEINSSLEIISIDGDEISSDNTISSEKYEKLKEEYNLFKKTIAEAITSRGIQTSENDSKEKMTENINAISGSLVLVAENLSGRYEQTISLSDKVNYDKLTIDDFVFVIKKMEFVYSVDGENIPIMEKSYDEINGILRLGKQKYNWNIGTDWTVYDVYIYYK